MLGVCNVQIMEREYGPPVQESVDQQASWLTGCWERSKDGGG